MLNKYQRLSKEEQLKARVDFRKYDAKHNNTCYRFKRLKNMGLLALIVGIIGITYELIRFFVYTNRSFDVYLGFVSDISLLIFGIFFIYQSKALFERQVNLYLIEQAKKQNKKKDDE